MKKIKHIIFAKNRDIFILYHSAAKMVAIGTNFISKTGSKRIGKKLYIRARNYFCSHLKENVSTL